MHVRVVVRATIPQSRSIALARVRTSCKPLNGTLYVQGEFKDVDNTLECTALPLSTSQCRCEHQQRLKGKARKKNQQQWVIPNIYSIR